jgi:hypothetical protein
MTPQLLLRLQPLAQQLPRRPMQMLPQVLPQRMLQLLLIQMVLQMILRPQRR